MWLPIDVCVPTASLGLSVREVMSTTLHYIAFLPLILHHAVSSALHSLRVKWFSKPHVHSCECDLMLYGGLLFVTEDDSCLVMPTALGMWFVVEHLHVKLRLRSDHCFPHLLSNNALGKVMSVSVTDRCLLTEDLPTSCGCSLAHVSKGSKVYKHTQTEGRLHCVCESNVHV